MKIAVFLDSYSIGGVQKVFISLANEWAKQGHSVFIYVLQTRGEFKGELNNHIRIIELNCSRLLKSFFIVSRLLKQQQIDYFLVGKDAENLFFIVMKLLTRFKAKLIISQHNYSYFEGKADNHFYRKFLPIAMKYLYHYADHIICVSKGIEQYVKTLHIKDGQTTVIYNPLEIEQIQKNSLESINETGKFISFCGRLSSVKNIDLLINGFEIFFRSHQDYHLLILGSGREETRLKQLVEKKGISDVIRFVGSVANPHRYIARSEVLVLPSFTEAFSITICEAFVSGITVVSTPSGGPNELLANGRGYLLKSFNDAEEMAYALNYACEHPIDSKVLKEYVKKFDVSHIASQYIDTFIQI